MMLATVWYGTEDGVQPVFRWTTEQRAHLASNNEARREDTKYAVAVRRHQNRSAIVPSEQRSQKTGYQVYRCSQAAPKSELAKSIVTARDETMKC